MVIICIVLVIAMMAGGKETYYGVMKNGTTIDKMISEKDEKIEKNVKLPSDADVSVKKRIS